MLNEKKILIADHSDHITAMISSCLKREAYKTMTVRDGIHVLEQYAAWNPDMLILDIDLPGIDGLLLTQTIRQSSHIPIVLIGDEKRRNSLIRSLRHGADDYLIKPIDADDMCARVFALFRRSNIQPDRPVPDPVHDRSSAVISYPDLSIDKDNYTVVCRGTVIEMPPKEIELLSFLASSPNQVFSRDQLLDHIWGYDYSGDTRTVDVHIKRIREKLGDHESWRIATVWSVGYRFQTERGSQPGGHIPS